MRPKEGSKSTHKVPNLEHKAHDKAEFFLAASHQLKSPVAIIQWCLQSILEEDKIDQTSRKLIVKALNQANGMSVLITDMLHIFRLANRRGKNAVTTYAPVDVNKVLVEALDQCQEAANRHSVHLVRGAMEVLPSVMGEEAYLRQAVINLVDNAIKYSPEGSKVTVTTSLREGGWIEMAVKDEGIGISDTEQGQLFREFFRGSEAQETTSEGTGLGLVLVKHIVEEMGGEIVVQSRLHHGSTFILRLPSAGH
jgi:signal transduction histidine kinase